jgi:hypothetical protein
MGKLRDLHYELLEHPPCSPDLAPSDFCVFPKLKLFLAGQRFSLNKEAIAAVEGYFADLTMDHYRDGIMVLEHRWNKCISLKGDYVENKNQFEIINSFFQCQAENFSGHRHTQNSTNTTNTHALSGIRTRHPNTQAAADLLNFVIL